MSINWTDFKNLLRLLHSLSLSKQIVVCEGIVSLTLCWRHLRLVTSKILNFDETCTLILFYKQHMIKKTSWTFLDFIQSLLIFVAYVFGMSIEMKWRNDEMTNFWIFTKPIFWSTKLRQPRQCRDSCTYYIIFRHFVISSFRHFISIDMPKTLMSPTGYLFCFS